MKTCTHISDSGKINLVSPGDLEKTTARVGRLALLM